MKIAYIYDVVYPYIKGGAEKRFWELAYRLSARGHQVHIFGMKSWEGDACFIKEGVHIHGLGKSRNLYLESGKRDPRQVIFFTLCLLPVLWRERFDIIDCNAFPYLSFLPVKIFSRFKRIPLVITWQEVWGNYWYRYSGYALGLMGRLIEKTVILLSPYNIAHSLTTRDRLISMGMQAKNVRIIGHGIDFEIIRDTPPAAEKSDLIFAGRLIREKGVDLLLDAVSSAKKERGGIKCLVIGDGPERINLITLRDKMGLRENIVFKGTLEYVQIISLMKSSGVFVFPSVREGFGIVVIEAMACGLPVITVNHPMNAAAELIRDNENGFLCQLDAADVSRKILYLLNNEASRREFSRAARDHVKDYDWDRVAQDNEDFYNFIIRKETG